jgi:hypothetical protein
MQSWADPARKVPHQIAFQGPRGHRTVRSSFTYLYDENFPLR